MPRKVLSAALLLAACLLLGGCADTVRFEAGRIPADSTWLQLALEPGETTLLDAFPALESADFSGSRDLEEVSAWAGAHPDVDVYYRLTLPDGQSADTRSETLTLDASRPELFPETARLLPLLPALQHVQFEGTLSAADLALFCEAAPQLTLDARLSLGSRSFSSSDRTLQLHSLTAEELALLPAILPGLSQLEELDLGDHSLNPEVDLETVCALQHIREDLRIHYRFELYGKAFSTADTVLDLNHTPVEDEGTAVREILPFLPRVELLDMDSCGVSNEAMAQIRDDFPAIKVVWRIWFAEKYSVRTDVERILASKPQVAGIMTEESVEALQYCTEVRYLDIGHNPDLHSIDFVRYMPKLEVAILAMDLWSDASALAFCPELEYLEIQTTYVSDISPLAGLSKLKHLNICYLHELTDLSPLYGLTQLERLWIGCLTPIPDEQVAKMQELAPNCVINTTTLDPTDQEWRYARTGGLVPRYEKLREQFGGYHNSAFAFFWNDPLY